MRGQTSLEMLILLSSVIAVAVSFVYFASGRARDELAVTGARIGVENAIAQLRAVGGEYRIERVYMKDKTVVFSVLVTSSPLSDGEIENFLRSGGIRAMGYYLAGVPASGPVGGYDVRVEISRK